MGYHLAFPDAEIIGVDVEPQPNYPFTFVQMDGLDFDLEGADLVHASPPCQALTSVSNRWRGLGGKADQHVNLIPEFRAKLVASGSDYVVENVPGARRFMHRPVVLNGGMFGLGVARPRLFECSFDVTTPATRPVANPLGVYGAMDGRRLSTRKDGSIQRAAKNLAEAREAMGIDWMEWRELAEAIPPAYTEHIGKCLAGVLSDGRVSGMGRGSQAG